MCGYAYQAENDRSDENKQFHQTHSENTAAAIMNKNRAPSAPPESLLVQHKCRWSKIRHNSVIAVFNSPRQCLAQQTAHPPAFSLLTPRLICLMHPVLALLKKKKLHRAKLSLPWSTSSVLGNEVAPQTNTS